MPTIIDYPAVLDAAQRQGLVSLYFNSGAFGFASTVATHSVGWVADDDPTIRSAARALAITVAAPAEATLATLAARAWQELLPGDVWLTPKSHWAYELDFGSAAWMPDLLRNIGVDPAAVEHRHDGSALCFSPTESTQFTAMVQGLLTHLLGSDFELIFPGRDVICTVHHHKQLWWTSPDVGRVSRLRAMAAT